MGQMRVGFVILTHNEPRQLLRLVRALNAIFGEPAVAVHHDFGKCFLDEARFPPNVGFVHPHLTTGWGDISLVNAALLGLRQLRERQPPDWYVLLSGADYPVRPGREILADLAGSGHDVHIDHRELLPGVVPPGQTAEHGYDRPQWIPTAYRRYCMFRLSVPFWRTITLKYHRLDRLTHPFRPDRPRRVFAGDFWFQANRRAVDRIFEGPLLARLLRYYRRRPVPDESLFHTAFCSQPDLRISKRHRRFEDWLWDGAHPAWLDEGHLPRFRESGAHFARKFRPDGAVQDLVDRELLGISPPPRRRGLVLTGS